VAPGKIATNSDLAGRMQDIIDVETGPIIAGEKTMEQMGEAILESIIQVASGEVRAKAELLGRMISFPGSAG